MKQFTSIFSVLAIAAMSASCAQEMVETSASGFKSEIRLTAGTVSSKSSDASSREMKVSAYTESSRYFTDIYEMSGNMWEGSQKRYWPEESGRMSFYGYPCNVNLVETAQGVGFDWTVANEDLKVAKAEVAIGTSKVELVPESVLSTVNITINGTDESVQYVISSVEMKNVKSRGYYSFTNNTMKAYDGSETAFAIPAEGAVLYMIPQSINDVQVVVNYSIQHNGVKVFEGEYSTPLSGSWKQGRSYDWTISLPNKAKSIHYDVSVADWD